MILACVHEIEYQDWPEKYVSICCNSQAALKALWAAKTSPLVRQCWQACCGGLYWVPWHAGVRRNEIADRLARSGSVQRFVGPEPFLGVSRQNIKKKDEMLDGETTSGIVVWPL